MLYKPKYPELKVLPLAAATTLDDVKSFMESSGVAHDFAGQASDGSFVLHLNGAERTLLLPREMLLVVAGDTAFGCDPRLLDMFYGLSPEFAE